jgi:hypothetical protein
MIEANLSHPYEFGIVSGLYQRILEGNEVCICRLIGGAWV